MEFVSERHEEVLETIWVMSEKKDHSCDSIIRSCDFDFCDNDFSSLEGKGYIVLGGGKVLFTEKGKERAERVVRLHRLTEVLVSSILKMKRSQADEIACKFEHTLVPEVEEAICTLLGHPDVCPDGNPIPRGRCCGKRVKTLTNIVASLSDLDRGERGKISFIRPDSHEMLPYLFSFGLNPGVVVQVSRKTPAFTIKFDNTELALDKEIAKNIFVLRLHELRAD